MRALVVVCALMCSCEWGPWSDCPDFDEDVGREMAEQRGVLDVFNRLDLFCEPLSDVRFDCQNGSAESCLMWRGSAVSRARIYASGEAEEGVMPLLEHELTHAGGPRLGDECEQHPPSCDGR